AYNIFSRKAYVAAAELTLQKDFSFPIRTYKSMETDPMNALTNSLSKLGEDEGAVIQLLISPAHNHWQAKARSNALQIQQGRNPDVVTSSKFSKAMNATFRGMGYLFDEFFSSKKNNQSQYNRQGYMDHSGYDKPLQLTPMQQDMIKK